MKKVFSIILTLVLILITGISAVPAASSRNADLWQARRQQVRQIRQRCQSRIQALRSQENGDETQEQIAQLRKAMRAEIRQALDLPAEQTQQPSAFRERLDQLPFVKKLPLPGQSMQERIKTHVERLRKNR